MHHVSITVATYLLHESIINVLNINMHILFCFFFAVISQLTEITASKKEN